jgi:hypothetical protein
MGNAKSRIIGSRSKPGRVVTVELEDGPISVELKSPNKALQAEIAQAAGVDETGKGAKVSKLIAYYLVACAYEPGTSKRMFDDADVEALEQLGAEFDPLLEAALEMFRGVKDAPGKSEATTG